MAEKLEAGSDEISEPLGIVDGLDRIEPGTFKRRYIDAGRPVVLRAMMESWPAMRKWSFEYFASIADDKRYRLDVGNVLQDDTQLEDSGLRQYLETLARRDRGAGGADGKVRYLSNFDLFGSFPALRDDIDLTLIRRNKRQAVASGWIGPAGTFTGWHTDYADNVLAQVSGRKVVDLVPPAFRAAMYPSAKFDRGATLSRIGDGTSLEQFPLHRCVRVERTVLDSGKMIFIPKGWWHRVRSLEPSISVSFLGFSWPEEISLSRNLARARTALHLVRLYGRDCTCHVGRATGG